jgi:hypothetical protein
MNLLVKDTFTPIVDLKNKEKGWSGDIIGVVMDVGPVVKVITSTFENDKRSVLIGDTTASVFVLLWNFYCD